MAGAEGASGGAQGEEHGGGRGAHESGAPPQDGAQAGRLWQLGAYGQLGAQEQLGMHEQLGILWQHGGAQQGEPQQGGAQQGGAQQGKPQHGIPQQPGQQPSKHMLP